jgi:hypothetical protein
MSSLHPSPGRPAPAAWSPPDGLLDALADLLLDAGRAKRTERDRGECAQAAPPVRPTADTNKR